ncbi:diacylglycerol O-acyltransferase 1B isoform X1 [Glycine max]|uniref:diacylglycerol O-acyltransferase 1B isoform X1 n=1 Tax=Glycine max TaxID=3847 RepID=UPI0007190B68|nr:diacylglycerol O-acyltransferase 1B isoform X1 [Glycine max]|eukprot:XP_014624826.1 diacylglycerol O-acyltransferase 1B isoform X1 [Glycine max]
MAISDEPESVATALNHSSLRRRPSATSTAGLFNSPETTTDSSGDDLAKDSGSDDSINSDDAAVNSQQQNEKQDTDFSVLKFAYRPSVPAHRKVKESPLSSDTIFRQSHAGLFNLCIVVLVAVNSRLIIENLMKYGWLIKSGFWFSSKSLRDWPLFMCCLSLVVFPFAAFIVEKLAQRKCIPEPVVVVLHIIITSTSLFYPVLVILRCDSAFVSGVTLMLFSCVVWLKLVSYAHTNYDMRALTKLVEKGEALLDTLNMDYPYNVSFKSLAYFLVAPTLCYQPSYPRTPYIRKGWLFRQLVKLIIFTGVMGFIIEQYINPIVQNSQHPLKGNLLYATERVLKLSVPNLYVWLCMFYCFFHLWLNILAELLRFGDREFYKDWWNAKTVEDYWRMWNMPVHKWMIRHLYFPCLRHGLPKAAALLIAFLVSALFHELCIAVPCHIFKLWAFGGIMFQSKSNTNFPRNQTSPLFPHEEGEGLPRFCLFLFFYGQMKESIL